MSKKLLNLCMTALLSVVSTAAWALSEVNGVYQIGSLEDWVAFTELVNGGKPEACAVLTADFDKGTDGSMVGKDGVDYQGTFDGQGHTITLGLEGSGDYLGLFGFLSGNQREVDYGISTARDTPSPSTPSLEVRTAPHCSAMSVHKPSSRT